MNALRTHALNPPGLGRDAIEVLAQAGVRPFHGRAIAAFMDAALTIMPKRYRADCCIAFCRIGLDILRDKLRMPVGVLTVTACGINAAFLAKGRLPDSEEEGEAWKGEGCHSVILGLPDHVEPGGWPGHLVLHYSRTMLIDGTLAQASRPKKGIELAAIVTPAPWAFFVGEEKLIIPIKAGGELHYDARPADRSYLRTRSWLDKAQRTVTVKEIWRLMRERLDV